MKNKIQKEKGKKTELFIDFSKASQEACTKLFLALNREVEEARGQNRFPSLETALSRLCVSTTPVMQ